jgi:hypothetical protein
MVDLTTLNRIHSVDAGVSLDTLMRRLVPLAWVPVSPATQQVTLGGAIAETAVDVVVVAVLEKISSSGHISFVNVLKHFGAGNLALLSLAPGWTLTFDAKDSLLTPRSFSRCTRAWTSIRRSGTR